MLLPPMRFMSFSRRLFLTGVGVGLGASLTTRLIPSAQAAEVQNTVFTPRAYGNPKAPMVVEEWFSLTCIHCAEFVEKTFPTVKKNLIDTGKVYYIFHDFPTDKLAITAAMVARTLPPDRYLAFCTALLSNLDRWAYRQDGKQVEELKKMAAFAGMPGDIFDAAIANQKLTQFILDNQTMAENKYHIDATPTFRFNHKEQAAGALSYDTFLSDMKKAT